MEIGRKTPAALFSSNLGALPECLPSATVAEPSGTRNARRTRSVIPPRNYASRTPYLWATAAGRSNDGRLVRNCEVRADTHVLRATSTPYRKCKPSAGRPTWRRKGSRNVPAAAENPQGRPDAEKRAPSCYACLLARCRASRPRVTHLARHPGRHNSPCVLGRLSGWLAKGDRGGLVGTRRSEATCRETVSPRVSSTAS